jgi:nucleotide-binding universal stress UspA family protein
MYRHILVPLKWDATDEAIVDHAAALAQATGGTVTLLHVVHSHSRDEATYLSQEIQKYLDQLAAKASSRGVKIATKITTGEPAEGISKAASEMGADLVVMGTHGHSEVRHLFVGSVTEDVIRQIETPVLLVRPLAGD